MSSSLLRDVPLQWDTQRLHIRCPQPGDGPLVHAAVVESLAALREFPASLPWAMLEPSVLASEKFCRQGQVNYLLRTNLPMLLFLKGSNILVGCSGLHAVDWAVPKCEIGYWGRTSLMGQGLITEAVKGITAFAFTQLGMRRVQALTDAANLQSCRVCERAGYVLEGTMRSTRVYAAVNVAANIAASAKTSVARNP
jgi:RimJ/RimL family protein N-acetyltransferase